MGLSGVAPCLLVLINIGSTVVFNDVVSLTLVALYSTYFICISLLLYRRVTGAIRRITLESEPSPVINSKDLAEAELCWGPWRVKRLKVSVS